MSTDVMPSKPKMLHKAINIFLIIVDVNYSIGMLSVSQFTGLHFHERTIIIVSALLLTLFMIIKEFKVKPLLKRIYLNLSILAGFFCIHYYVFVVW
jgi:hypothetical protein